MPDATFKDKAMGKKVFVLGIVTDFALKWSRTLTEASDFFKDVWYCYSVNHVDQNLTYLLWTFALFAFLYHSLSTLVLT